MRVARIVTSSIGASLLAIGGLLAVPPEAFAEACIEEAAGRNLTCTANDVRIAEARAVNVVGNCSDPDNTVDFDLVADVTPGPDRYDIGIYIEREGDARTGDECVVSTLTTGDDLDEDECLDITEPVTDQPAGHFDGVPCEDQDGNGELDVPSCLSWDNRKRDDCEGPDEAFPSTPSKCRCERVNVVNIPVDPCAGNTCNDGNACNGVETCDPADGSCDPGTPVTCGDGNACNGGEVCDPADGSCDPGTPVNCSDDNACNGLEVCDPVDGSCDPGTPVNCSDNNACNGLEICDPADGSCDPGTPVNCSDNNACNGLEVCDPADGSCDPGTPVDCSSFDDQCNDGVCNPATGACFKDPTEFEGDPCQDGDFCTSDDSTPGDPDKCVNGTCTGIPVNCDALDDQCNEGVCDPANGQCVKDPTEFEGDPCDDTLACTSATTEPGDPDECRGGICTGDPVNCDDENACTGEEGCDPASGCTAGTPVVCTPLDECHDAGTCDPSTGTCSNPEKPQDTLQSARAFGVNLRLLGQPIIAPTPDTGDVTDGSVTEEPANINQLLPLVAVNVLRQEANAGDGHADASSETAHVQLLDLTGTGAPLGDVFLVEASAIKSQVSCDATQSTAGCNSDGSTIVGLKIAGQDYGTVTPNTKPDPVVVNVPGLGTATVSVLEETGSGANDGVNQPEGLTNHADLMLRAIHVSIVPEPEGAPNPILELIVAEAKADVTSGPVCQESAHVSGRALVAGVLLCQDDGNACDQDADPANQILHVDAGRVDLPTTGGDETRTIHLGPIPDLVRSPDFTLVDADTALSHTDGTVNGSDANSHSKTHVEEASIINTNDGSPQSAPLIYAKLIESECNSTTDGGGSSSGNSILADATIGGESVCEGLQLAPTPCPNPLAGDPAPDGDQICCSPAPNTDACAALNLTPLCEGLGVTITLNEQTVTNGNPTEITVHAIHVTAQNPLTLPFNADVKVSSVHCDAGAPTTTP